VVRGEERGIEREARSSWDSTVPPHRRRSNFGAQLKGVGAPNAKVVVRHIGAVTLFRSPGNPEGYLRASIAHIAAAHVQSANAYSTELVLVHAFVRTEHILKLGYALMYLFGTYVVAK